MGQSYVGEIRMFAGNFAPAGWAFCDGSIMQIAENETLFNLIGTTYGGDGQSTFAVPDLRGRTPIHMGQRGAFNYSLAETGGIENVTLGINQIPSHSHALTATSTGQTLSPQNAYPAVATSSQAGVNAYTAAGSLVALAPSAVQASGGSQPHTNIQPSLAVNFIISLFGIFPSQT